MVPYGNVLTPFEIYCMETCLDVSLVSRNLMHNGGRILDFTNIELLQQTTTIAPTQSGSSLPYTPQTYYSDGYPIDYNFKLKGADFVDVSEAREWFINYNKSAGNTIANAVVNGYINSADGYQYLSVHNVLPTASWRGRKLQNMPITEVYDLKGLFLETSTYAFESPNLEIASFPASTLTDPFLFGGGAPKLRELLLPSLTNFGNTTGQDSTQFNGFSTAPANLKITVNEFMQTANAGALEGDLQHALDLNKGIEITFAP